MSQENIIFVTQYHTDFLFFIDIIVTSYHKKACKLYFFGYKICDTMSHLYIMLDNEDWMFQHARADFKSSMKEEW